ncbi:hypothetical protein [Agromyces seonyuensis]|uniref:Uncharacterized protein n=1 Tax=Agromyces seonyuensis TaxID=2662446 RepID=A0A6I4NUX0_9MICO|nr:hypothetical protein [Agromyces seonyuensis]MWB97891.1 hypothetical protein [Agromyces seonyuensis]
MYSLQVGLNDGSVPAGRLFEYTDDALRSTLLADFNALQGLPVLAMPEVGDDRFEQVAYIGTAISVRQDGRGHRFTFVRNPRFLPISLAVIEELAGELAIGDWELRRTHWAVKNVDLFEVLLSHQPSAKEPSIDDPSAPVQFPITTTRDPKLVGVMMPFDASFDIVYETIQEAVADAGLACVRADNIWEHQHVMGDVLSILWRSQIVIADLTGKNANVFYEAGLAHALPRPTILLTQDPADVPFDLQAIRYLRYGLGTADRAMLRKQLTERLTVLAKQASA